MRKLRDCFVKNSQRVSLTTDTWTSMKTFALGSWLCTLLRVNEKCKKEFKIAKIANYKGETIRKAIESCLEDWGIDKSFTIMVQNAASDILH